MSPDPRCKWFRQPGIAATIFLGSATPALADDPAFDRPGIAFAASTLPARAWAWEQGLPDFQQDRVDGVTEDAYLANTRIRFGVTDRFEVQVAVPLFMEVHSQGAGRAFRESGTGDFSVAAKFALGPGDVPVEMAVLAALSFPTATRREFGSDSELYSLGVTMAHAVGDTQSIALYANVDVLDGEATWTLSPNWSFSLGDSIGGYLEAGFQPAAQGTPASHVAGGGLTWLVRPAVQLDVYFLSGLTEESTDASAGLGVSVFVP